MHMTKKLLAAGTVLAVGLLTGGCTSTTDTPAASNTSAAPATTATSSLVVWVDAERADALAQAATDYEAQTGIKVEIVARDNSTLKDDFIQQAGSGSGPDVVMGAHDWLGELTTNGVVAPLELGDKASGFLPVALDATLKAAVVALVVYAALPVLRTFKPTIRAWRSEEVAMRGKCSVQPPLRDGGGSMRSALRSMLPVTSSASMLAMRNSRASSGSSAMRPRARSASACHSTRCT